MRHVVRFHIAAREEAVAAAAWYEQRELGLGQEFVDELERTIEAIAEAPESWPVSPDDPRARRILLARFPYSVVYVVSSVGDVVVAAVAHEKRRPGFWRARLSSPTNP